MHETYQTQMANLITSLAGQLQLKLIFHGKNSKKKKNKSQKYFLIIELKSGT